MRKLIVSAIVAMMSLGAFADEGMWLLPLLKKLNIGDMQAKGLELSAEDIYNINGSSLKDAIVIFGGGCTGEIVSPEGLLFTNHHCGFGTVFLPSELGLSLFLMCTKGNSYLFFSPVKKSAEQTWSETKM